MGQGIGGVLEIPDNLEGVLDKIDKKLNDIAKSSADLSNKFNSNMQSMANSVNPLLTNLTSLNTQLGNIDLSKMALGINSAQTSTKGLNSELTTTAKRTEDVANSIAQVANEFTKKPNGDKPILGNTEESINSIQTLEDELKKLKQYSKEIDLGKDLSNRKELEQTIKKVQELEITIKSLKKTASSTTQMDITKAIGMPEATINQRIAKVKELRRIQKDLDTTTRAGVASNDSLNASIRRLNAENANAIAGSKELRLSHRKLMDTAGQLARRMALVFSVSQITGYINSLIKVRGEFELQNRALQAIIQNKAEADKLFGQITTLAVKSPFRLRELITYTKQLSAYRVETEKLYDTTKMLADVSAGLGVDMQRLILAYGQVKAANYLRGQELRQFSESGINILGELADYFTKLNGKIVTTGDVFEMVSKRMVTFGDVEKIFQKLTSEGGIFYNMQEIQAETLAGQISNLRDSMDIMFNEIGKANEGTLKNTVALIRSLVENWELLSTVLKPFLYSFIAYKGTLAAVTVYETLRNALMAVTNKELAIQEILLKKSTLAQKGFNLAAKANPYVLIASLALGVIMELYGVISLANNKQKELNDTYNNTISKLNTQSTETNKYVNILYDLNKEQKEIESNLNKMEKGSKAYADEQKKLSNIEDDRKKVLTELSKVDETFAQQIRTIAVDTNALAKEAEKYNTQLRIRLGLESSLKGENISEWNETYNDLAVQERKALGDLENTRDKNIDGAKKLLESDKKLYGDKAKVLENFIKGTEPYAQRAIKLYQAFSMKKADESQEDIWSQLSDQSFFDLSPIKKYIEATTDLSTKASDFSKTMRVALENIKKTESGERLWKIITDINIPPSERDKAKNELTSIYTSFLDEKAISADLRKETDIIFKNVFKYNPKIISIPTIFEGWQRSFNDYARSLESEIEGLKLPAITIESNISKAIDEAKEQVDIYKKAYEDIKTAKGVDKEEVKIQKEYYEATKKYYEYISGKKYDIGDKGKDLEEEKWKNRIALLKKVNSEYEKLRKTKSEEEATIVVTQTYGKELGKAGMLDREGKLKYSLSVDDKGFVDTVSQMAKEAGDKYQSLFDEAANPVIIQTKIDTDMQQINAISDKIANAFSGYDLSIELDKSGLDKNIISQLFGVDTFNIDELTATLKPKIRELYAMGGSAAVEEAKKTEQKLAQMRFNATVEQAKEYAKYLQKTVDERILVEKKAQEDIRNIQKMGLNEEAQQVAKANIQKEASAKIAKLNWEELKGTELYRQAFEDTERLGSTTLKLILEELEKFAKDGAEALDTSSFKEFMTQIKKIRDEVESSNMWETLTIGTEEYRDALKQVAEAQKRVKTAEDEEKSKKLILTQSQDEKEQAERDYENALPAQQVEAYRKLRRAILAVQDAEEDYSSAVGKTKIETENLANAEDKRNNALTKMKSAVSKAKSKFDDLTGAVSGAIDVARELAEGLGMSFSPETEAVINSIGKAIGIVSAALGVVLSVIIAITIAGTAMMVVLWPLLSIAAALAAVMAVFAVANAKKQRQIDQEKEKVDALERSYDELKKKIEDAFSFDSLKKANNLAQKNLDDRIASTKKLIALEEDKKKTDKDKVKEYKNNLEDLYQQQKELREKYIEDLGGFGSAENIKSASQEFIDAWMDAFNETGNGLDGLTDKFNEFIENTIKKQMMLKFAERFLRPIYTAIDRMFEEDSAGGEEVTKNELDAVKELGNNLLPQLNDALIGFADAIGYTGDTAQSELSGLQQGIQGVTEDTAQALEALLNSMRFFVSDSNQVLKNFYNAFTSQDAKVNPILAELKAQTEQIRLINSFLTSIGKSGHPQGGQGIKVFLN